MGVGSDQTSRSEPLVLPVLEKTTKVPTASPTKTSSSALSKPPSPAKGAAAPPPASSSKPPPAPSGKKISRRSINITAEQLSGDVQDAVAQPTGYQALTMHVGRAAFTVSEKISAQTGQIIELNHAANNLGALQKYVDAWNTSDMTEATLGVKDGQVVMDTRGPRNTVQHMHWLKRCMHEFYNAWYDVDKNVLVSFSSGLTDMFST
jgi:hypothetical protein